MKIPGGLLGKKTPFLVLDKERLSKNAEEFKKAFSACRKTRFFYSYKTNSLPFVCRFLEKKGFGAEVVSGMELELAEKLSVSGERIVFNGPAKSREDLKRALDHGVYAVNAETVSELEVLDDLACGMKKKPRVGIRLDTGVSASAPWFLNRVFPRKKGKFGSHVSSSQTFSLFEKALAMENLDVCGLQFHLESQLTDPGVYLRALEKTAAFCQKVGKLGFGLKYVDIGGGFGVKGVRMPGRGKKASEIGVFGEKICSKFGELFPAKTELLVEPGRWLVSDAMEAVSGVLGVKNAGKTRWAYLDIGTSVLSFRKFGEVHRIRSLRESDSLLSYVVAGPLCFGEDVLGKSLLPADLKRGDRVVVEDAGAYSLSMSSSFSFPRPPVYSVDSKGSVSEVWRQEGFGDVFGFSKKPSF